LSIKQDALNELSSTKTNLINELLDTSHSNERILKIAKEINPFFYSNIICCYSLFKKIKSDNQNNYYKCYLSKLVELKIDSKEYILSIIEYKYGILIIFSYNNNFLDINQHFTCFLGQLECLSNDSNNGISSPGSLDHLKDIIKESIYAAISCKIDEIPFKYFNKIGVDQLLIPSAKEYGPKKFYENYFNILSSYDKANNMNLLETLRLYIQSACDIDLVSKTLFQHRNTIRYRINKIKTLLEVEHLIDADFQLYLFIRLYLINQLNYLLPDAGPK